MNTSFTVEIFLRIIIIYLCRYHLIVVAVAGSDARLRKKGMKPSVHTRTLYTVGSGLQHRMFTRNKSRVLLCQRTIFIYSLLSVADEKNWNVSGHFCYNDQLLSIRTGEGALFEVI